MAYDSFIVMFLYETYAQVLVSSIFFMGFPGGLMVKNPPAMQVAQVPSLSWEDPLEKEMATHSSILAWKIHGQRSLVGYSPWGHKSPT